MVVVRRGGLRCRGADRDCDRCSAAIELDVGWLELGGDEDGVGKNEFGPLQRSVEEFETKSKELAIL